MNKIYYPAVFQQEEVGFSVWLYDIDGCISQGDTFEEAIENITDALGLFFEEYHHNKIKAPNATSPCDIKLDPGQFVAIVGFDWLSYQKKHNTKAVKKTLSIPGWLNTLAEEQHINFSSVLQSALKDKLNV